MRWIVRGALLVLLSFANLNLIWSPDVLPNTLFAWTLVGSGNVDYDEFATVSPTDERPDRIDRTAYFFRGCAHLAQGQHVFTTTPRSAGGPPPPLPGEHVCSIFPPGVAILALPILVPAALLGVPASDATSLLLLGHLVASILEAIVALVLWSVFRRFVSAGWSVGLVLLYFLATSVRTVASQALWQHAGVHLAIAAALWLVLDERAVSAGRAVLAGLALGLGTVARQTAAFVAAGIVSRRTFMRVVAGFGIGIVPLIVYNAFAFGDPFEQGYGTKPFDTPILTGLYGLLLSPSRGLLVYAPYLAFAIAALVLAWRRRGHVAARLRGLGIVALATLLLYATYTEWWGGRVFGARFLDDQAPILFVALAWAIGQGLLSRALWRRLFWIGAAWSLLLFNAAALVYDQTWDTAPVNVNFHPEKLFDWGDPQWLAVLRALPSGGTRAAIGLALSLCIVALLLRLEGGLAAAPIVERVTTTAFILFFGPGGESPVEAQLDRIRIAIGSGTLRRAAAAGFAPLIAVTADPAGARAFGEAGAEPIAPRTEPFHFGTELKRIVDERHIDRVCAIGAGAGALLTAGDLGSIRDDLERSPALVLSNNYYSADLVALTPTSALDAIALPATDNPLPRLLHQQAGLPSRQLPRSAATLLDVDTPPDATVLLRHPHCPAELQSVGAFEPELGARVDALMTLVTTAERELLVAGRVGAPVWSYLESQTACRVRMLAEERGMQAAGRDLSGNARTALGFLYELVGAREFFERMTELGDGMLFDSRVLFAHLGWRPSAPDRFSSDLLQPDAIEHAGVREFTTAARDAGFPLLLGGQTLVSGVLWTMVDAAWSGHPEQ